MAKYEPNIFVEFFRKGKSYGIRQRILSFEYEDSAEETNVLTLIVEDIRTVLIDHPELLDDGHTYIKFRFGYIGNLSPVHKARISYLQPSFPQNSAVTIKLKAHDVGLFVQKDVYTRVWARPEGYTADEIAEAIAKEMGLKAIVEPSKIRKLKWTQAKQTNMEFLKQIAKEAVPANKDSQNANYLVYVWNDELHFETKKNDSKHEFEYTYFPKGDGELISFVPEITEKKVDSSNDIRGLDGMERADESNTERTSLGDSDVTAGEKSGSGQRQMVDAVTGETWVSDKDGNRIK